MVISLCWLAADFAENAHGFIGYGFAQQSSARSVSDDSATSGVTREH